MWPRSFSAAPPPPMSEGDVMIQKFDTVDQDMDERTEKRITKLMKYCKQLNNSGISCFFAYQLPSDKDSIGYHGDGKLLQKMQTGRMS